jgi:hypothetical protein
MRIPYRPLVIGLATLAFSALILARAQAGDRHFFAPVTDPVVKEECGSCHMAFAPSMLPARSWRRMMGELDKHFGDDASLDAATAEKVTNYLVANAGDAGGQRFSGKLLKGVAPGSTPQRITELPKWVSEHRKVPDWEWRHKDVRTKANCVACHSAAEQGYYEE